VIRAVRREELDSESVNYSIQIIRFIIGNPFRLITINPTWLSPTVSTLAQAAYDERVLPSGELDSSNLAVLADALEDTGSQDADILGHLRSLGVHVRGCWASDLILSLT
jgi:hypothetical protein